MQIGTHFAKQFYKGIEGSEWEERYFHHREMSKAAGAKKPSKSHKKNKSPEGHEGSQRQGGGIL